MLLLMFGCQESSKMEEMLAIVLGSRVSHIAATILTNSHTMCYHLPAIYDLFTGFSVTVEAGDQPPLAAGAV